MANGNKSIDRFYKRSIVDRDKNLFLRVEELEEAIRSLKAGRPISVTTIQNIIENEWEFIRPSVAGGTSDPTDPTFTGVIISHSGQMINGVLYHFALVDNGVAWWGQGDNGEAVITASPKETLTANRTYYVRTDGSDSNNGLTNDAAGAFLTPQKAWDTIADTVLLNGFTATIQLASGTYPGINMSSHSAGYGFIVIQGDSGDLSAVTLQESAGTSSAITNVGATGFITVKYMTLDADFCVSCLYGCIGAENVKLAPTNSIGTVIDCTNGVVSLNTFEVVTASVSSLISASELSVVHLFDETLHASQSFSVAMIVLDNATVIVHDEVAGAFTGKGYDLRNFSHIETEWDIVGSVANTTDGTCTVGGLLNTFVSLSGGMTQAQVMARMS